MTIPPPPDEPSCGTCRYFVTGDANTPSHCRRFPPAPTRLVGNVYASDMSRQQVHLLVIADHPEVGAWDWCGEYNDRRGSS